MSLEIPTWDKIIGGLGSTTTEIGGNWANLISDYYNGVDIGLLDPSKKPIIGTLTRYKFEKLGIFDVDQSHYIAFSADDIDTGSTRKIKFRRMNSPYEEDYAVLEGLTQPILNKDIDSDLNNITNIVNADIKVGAGITDNKLAQITDKAKLHSNLVYTDQANTFATTFLQTFRQGQLAIFDSDDSHKYTITTGNIAGNFNLDIPIITANDTFALLGVSNIFTNYMTIRKDAVEPLHIYRPSNTGGNKHGIYFDAWDSAGAAKAYTALLSTISVNTAGAENGLLEFQTRSSGILATRMALNNSGALYIGSNLRLVLTQTGLTAERIFTFPDTAGQVVTQENANIFGAGVLQTFRASQFAWFDSNSSHRYTVTTGDLSTNVNINIPAMSTNDTFAFLGLGQTFTAAQKIQQAASAAFTVYRTSNTPGDGVGVLFNMQNASAAEVLYASIYGVVSSNTAGSEDGTISFQTKKAGTLAEKMSLNKDGLLTFGDTNKLSFSTTALTQARTVAWPNAGGNAVLDSIANSFAAQQIIQGNLTIPLVLRRTTNTAGDIVAGYYTELRDSVGNNTTYARIDTRIGTNTDTNETGFLDFWVMKNGSLSQYMVLDGNQLSLGLAGVRAILDSTGISGSSKTFTFPNLTGQLQTINATQTVSNKSQAARDTGNTFDYLRKYQTLEAFGSVQFRPYDIIGEGHFKDIQYYGSIISSDNDSSGYWIRLQSSSAAGAFTGLAHFSNVQASFRRAFNGWVIGKYQLFSSDYPLSGERLIFGFSDQQALPPDSDTLIGSGQNGFYIAFRSGTDTNYRILHNDATGTMVNDDSTVVFPTSSTIHELEIKMDSSGITWIIRNIGGTIQGQGTVTTRIPATTTKLYFYYGVIGNAKSILLRNAECKTGGH